MRITPALLLKVAQDTVSQRSQANHDILTAYLDGSLLAAEPLIGGATDIDLFFVYNSEAVERREIVRVTDNVHLDITHHSRDLYRQAKELRLHPWLGPSIYRCKILYDPQHFMDFTQASVRGQFNQPDNILARVRQRSERARQTWLSLRGGETNLDPENCRLYLQAVENAANAIASLSGSPLTERRFLLDFPQRARTVGHAGLHKGLLGLLGGPAVDADILRSWLPGWKAAFTTVSQADPPPRFHSCRLNYYLRAFEEILESEQPLSMLWALLSTWTRITSLLPPEAPERAAWQEACARLGLLGPPFAERVDALDSYLDTIEEILEAWAHRQGIE